MKKLNLLFLFTLIFSFSYGQRVKLNATDNQIKVTQLKSDSFTLETGLSYLDFNTIQMDEGVYTQVKNENLIKIFDRGMPNIPVISKLIEVPQDAQVEFEIVGYTEEIIKLNDVGINAVIAPALGAHSKSVDEIPFVKNEEIYHTDKFIFSKIATYQESGQMRATRLGRIEIHPLQYNPVQNTIKVLNNLVINVKFTHANFGKTIQLKKKYNTPYFNDVIASSVINFDPVQSKELITQAPTHLVIVSDPMFEAQLAPFIAWKVKKGFKVTVAYTNVIGSTTTAIKTYLQDIYNSADPMSFVLFVGDVQQIPAWNGNAGSHVTDLRYCEYTGDNLPEVYYGRFSAQNTSQLQPQIDKTLMYEQFTMSDPSYLSEVFLVAGDDSSHEMTWGNGQIWYGDNYYFNATNNINAHTYLQPLDNNAVSAIIVNDMNAGLAYANYTAHCSSSGWASPNFSTSDVNALTNAEKYGLWVGNCCLSVKFDDNECFGEAALRKENGGAIGDIGGSNSTYWDEDYWWGVGLTASIVAEPAYEDSGRGAYDGLFHNLANESADIATWFPTQGQTVVCGDLAVEESTSSRKEYYWEIYHLMGDPTVMNYIGTPQSMTVTPNPTTLLMGMTSLNVSTDPYAYVALSQNGVLVAAAVADASGNATLNFGSNDLMVGDADLVVTAQNRIPYIGTIGVSPADQPYIVLNSYTTSAAPDYGQTIDLNVALENVANAGSGYDATNVVATLSSSDTYVTINDNNETYGTIVAGEVMNIDAAYNITIADDVPDQYVIPFDLSIVADGYTWNSVLNLTVNAPALSIGNLTIDDSATGNADGILDPGETADITIQTTNEGHADVTNVISTISTTFVDMTINSATAPTGTLAIGETGNFEFNLTADAGVAPGTEADITNDVTGGSNNQCTANKEFTIIIGFVPEYCESYATSTADSMIEEVSFGSVVNNTEAEGCSSYSDFTEDETLTDSFAVGSTNDISFYIGTCNGTYTKAGKVYIDWNYDGDFDDAGEMVYESVIANANWMEEGTFTVPTGISSGPRFMRIVVSEDENNINPCGTYSWGETEDYKIYVYDPLGVEENTLVNLGIYPNPNMGTFTIDFSRINTDSPAQIDVFNMNGQQVYHAETSNKKYQLSLNNNTGIYFVKIQVNNQVSNHKIIITQ